MGINRWTLHIELLLVLAIYSLSVASAQQKLSTRGSRGSSGAGRSLFNSSCAPCHGLDGRGSDKAVNISGSERVRKLSDAQLSSIVSNGVPDTGMPAFHTLTATQVRAIVAYLRSLQGKSDVRALPGDPSHGKEIFFGKAGCSSCHAISGQGGFLGPDLTEHGDISSVEAIREEIINVPRTPAMGYRRAAVTAANGDRMEGIVRNEDNFSLQLQTKDGTFHFLNKSELQNFERLDGSLMPADYRDRLSESELNDLASFLLTIPRSNKDAARSQKGYDDE